MIKLIATDLDGTLLDDKKRLPQDFFEVLDRLFEKEIHFAVSSGRTYSAVEHLFPEEYRKKMDFICDNGACILRGGELIDVTPLDRKTYVELLDACEKIGGLKVIACAAGGTYHLSEGEEFNAEVSKFYKNHVTCDNLYDVQDTIFKLAICDEQGTMQRAKPAVDAIFGSRLNVQVSGAIWMDVMASGITKGKALSRLGESIGAQYEQIMAFGDYFNDVEMLKAAGWSFCMENGHEDVKKLCRYIAPSNNDSGVTKMICKYVLGDGE